MAWLLVGRGDILPFLPGPLVAAGLVAAAWSTRNPVLVTATAGGIASGCWVLFRQVRSGRGLPVEPRGQPELAGLVADTARRLGLRAPENVWLTAGPNATALSLRFPRRRDEICLGVCSVAAMSGEELRATVAHELAHLAGPDQGPAGVDAGSPPCCWSNVGSPPSGACGPGSTPTAPVT